MAKSKKRRKIIIFSIAGLVLIALTAGAILRKREAVITIQTEKVTRRNLTELVTANGKVQPVLQVKISPEVSGEIIALPVKEGQHVNKGDLILKIKPDFYQAARNQAEANYKSSLAGKATAEANLRKAEAEF
jgi:HlyD family secretion protein